MTACNIRNAICTGTPRVTVDITQTTGGADFNYGIALCHAAGVTFAACPVTDTTTLECLDSCTDTDTDTSPELTHFIVDPPCDFVRPFLLKNIGTKGSDLLQKFLRNITASLPLRAEESGE